jgi:mono/diheme cytochrome c family protein
MKKILIIAVIGVVVVIWGCGGKRSPGLTYMPDMAYSRAYETYASTANLDSLGIHYDKQPVPGTIKRGELFPFPYAQDKVGDSTNYVLSRQAVNPLDSMNTGLLKEAERLYLVNCGICHGGALDGNGPLYNGGNGPYAAAPRNLVTDPYILGMPDGQMFYSITYGKGQMGPYGPQLSTTQRWMIVNYIRAKQNQARGGSAPVPTTQGRAADSTAAVGVNVTDTTTKNQ